MIALVAGGGFEPPTFGLRGEIHPLHRTTPANQVQRNTEKSSPAVGSLWAALAAVHGQNTDRTRTEHGRNTARPVAEQSRSCAISAKESQFLEGGITHAARTAPNGKWQVPSEDESGPSVCRSSPERQRLLLATRRPRASRGTRAQRRCSQPQGVRRRRA